MKSPWADVYDINIAQFDELVGAASVMIACHVQMMMPSYFKDYGYISISIETSPTI